MASSSQKLRSIDKVERALALRAQRVSWDRIAMEIGYANRHSACRAVSAYLRSHPTPAVEQHREECAIELREVLRQAHATIRELEQSDYAPVTKARLLPPIWDSIVRANESLRRLYGADAPARLAVTDAAIDAELERMVAEVLSVSRDEPAPGPPALEAPADAELLPEDDR